MVVAHFFAVHFACCIFALNGFRFFSTNALDGGSVGSLCCQRTGCGVFCFFFAAKLQQDSCGPGQRRAILGPLINRLQARSCGGRLAALQMYFGAGQQRGSKTGALCHGCLESRKRSLFLPLEAS